MGNCLLGGNLHVITKEERKLTFSNPETDRKNGTNTSLAQKPATVGKSSQKGGDKFVKKGGWTEVKVFEMLSKTTEKRMNGMRRSFLKKKIN